MKKLSTLTPCFIKLVMPRISFYLWLHYPAQFKENLSDPQNLIYPMPWTCTLRKSLSQSKYQRLAPTLLILLSLRLLATCRSGKECARRQSLPRHGRALTSVVPLQIAPCSRKLLRLSRRTRRSAAPSASSPHGPCWRWPAAGWWPPPPPHRLDLHILPCYQVRHSLAAAADGPTDWPLVVCHYFWWRVQLI